MSKNTFLVVSSKSELTINMNMCIGCSVLFWKTEEEKQLRFSGVDQVTLWIGFIWGHRRRVNVIVDN